HLGVVARARERKTSARDTPTAGRIGQGLWNHIEDTTQRVGSVEHARGPANQLEAPDERRFHGRAVFVTPRVVLEPAAVVEHEHARSGEAADDEDGQSVETAFIRRLE